MKKWTITIMLATVLSIMVSGCGMMKKPAANITVSGMFINLDMSKEGTHYLTVDYVKHLGGSGDNSVAELNAVRFGDMMDSESGEDNNKAAAVLVNRVSGKALNYMLLDKFAMEYYITQDIYQDLRQTFTAEEMVSLEVENRVVYAMEEGSEDRVPIAIIITDTAFVKENINTEGAVYFALARTTQRPEMCRKMWEHINAWGN